MDTVRTFHRLIFDSSRDDLFTVVAYSLDEFDLTIFWKGIEVVGPIPTSVKLFVDIEKDNAPDLVGNPISWYICSERLLDYWLPLIEQDIQLCEAPLYVKKTNKKILGFKILNPLTIIEAMDMRKSRFISNKNKLKTVSKFVFEIKKIPENIHIFRPSEFPKAIIVSDELVKKIVGIGIRGLALIRCESV